MLVHKRSYVAALSLHLVGVYVSMCLLLEAGCSDTGVFFFMVSEFVHADAGMVPQIGFYLLPVLDYSILWCFVVEFLIASSVIL